MLRTDIPVFETTAAAGLLGAYPVPVNWHFSAEEVAYVLRDSAAKVLVVHTDLLWRVMDAITALERPPAVIAVDTPAHITAAYRVDIPNLDLPSGVLLWPQWLAPPAPWDPRAPPHPPRITA